MSALRRAAVVLLLGLFWWMAASVSRQHSATADEIAYTAAGYSYWTRHDHRLQPENGDFPQRWAALPLLVQPPRYPTPTEPGWAESDAWRVGFDLLYNLGNNAADILARERAMIALLGVALGALVFAWARALHGRAGGFVALGLLVLSPEMLAHGGLFTSDMAAALGFTAALLAWWRLLHRVTIGRLLAAGGGLGLLALSKYSVVIFAPVAVILAGLRLLHPTPLPVAFGRWRRRLSGAGRMAVVMGGGFATAALAVLLIWAAYDFRFSAMNPPVATGSRLYADWDYLLVKQPTMIMAGTVEGVADEPLVLIESSALSKVIAWTRDHRLLPEAWLFGLAYVDRHARVRPAYFAGEWSGTGWAAYFPVAFALKTTLPVLGLTLLTPWLAWQNRRRWRARRAYRLAPLLVFLLSYWLIAIASPLNIGHRHLLPTYPMLFILLGAAGAAAVRRGRGWLTATVLALLAWHVAESWRARPDYLAYFNQLAGGRDQGHRWFADSSLDWGQDLPGLKTWLDAHARGEKVFISYFGSGDLLTEGISATRLADFFAEHRPRGPLPELTGGIYAVSATMLHRVYLLVHGPWTAELEQAYARDEAWLGRLRAQPPGSPPTDFDGRPLAPDKMAARMTDLEELRFGRLCHFLELRPPEAIIGGSILIYRLTDAEVNSALHAPIFFPAVPPASSP